jgi:HK97 gp10 family phage protein
VAGDVEFQFDPSALGDLLESAETAALMQDAGNAVAATAADLAPKRTGAGAASIHAEVEQDAESFYADVSWDKDHFYMFFAEVGTEHESARPFLRPALDSTQI